MIRKTALVLVTLAGLAACQPAAQQMYTPTLLAIRGEGEVKRDAKTARVFVRAEARKPTGAEAMKAQAEQADGIVKALKAAGVAEADMQTRDFSLQPDLNWSGKGPRVRGYIASNNIEVTVKDLTKLGELLDKVAAIGGLIETSLSFDPEEQLGAREEAKVAALKDATAKAERYAAALGYKVKRVVTAREPGVRIDTPDFPQQDQAQNAAPRVQAFAQEAPPPDTPFIPGQNTTRAWLEVTFELSK
jgi:uncharacterized protein YggE